MDNAIKNYEDLIVWQKSMDLVKNTYEITSSFPQDEKFGLTSQLRRAAVSIASNIAEGSCRRTKAEFARFVNISSGSLAELETQFMIATRLSFISEIELKNIKSQTTEISKMLFALYRSLSQAKAA